VHLPGAPPARIDTPRSHVDLAKTLLELLGVPAAKGMRGESLVPELFGARPPQREIVIDMPYTDQTPRRRALIAGRHKLIVTESNEQPELYDRSRSERAARYRQTAAGNLGEARPARETDRRRSAGRPAAPPSRY
jgi:arylsulfatase A-like enzyme